MRYRVQYNVSPHFIVVEVDASPADSLYAVTSFGWADTWTYSGPGAYYSVSPINFTDKCRSARLTKYIHALLMEKFHQTFHPPFQQQRTTQLIRPWLTSASSSTSILDFIKMRIKCSMGLATPWINNDICSSEFDRAERKTMLRVHYQQMTFNEVVKNF